MRPPDGECVGDHRSVSPFGATLFFMPSSHTAFLTLSEVNATVAGTELRVIEGGFLTADEFGRSTGDYAWNSSMLGLGSGLLRRLWMRLCSCRLSSFTFKLFPSHGSPLS